MTLFLFFVLSLGLFSPVDANAENIYLILLHGRSGVEKIEMSDMTQCQEKGESFKSTKNKLGKKSFICIQV